MSASCSCSSSDSNSASRVPERRRSFARASRQCVRAATYRAVAQRPSDAFGRRARRDTRRTRARSPSRYREIGSGPLVSVSRCLPRCCSRSTGLIHQVFGSAQAGLLERAVQQPSSSGDELDREPIDVELVVIERHALPVGRSPPWLRATCENESDYESEHEHEHELVENRARLF